MAQEGFLYEKNAAAFLKKANLVDKNFQPAGAGHSTADLVVTYKKKKINVELKITAASGGSLVLKYDEKRPRGKKWYFNDVSGDPEKQFLVDVANEVKALDMINKMWNKLPLKRENMTAEEKKRTEKIDKRKQYAIDAKNFPEINKVISGTYIEKYYNRKDTYYVNVGTSGFYLFGPRDPDGLNKNLVEKKLQKIPKFSDSARVKFRARVQAKGGGNYQFTFELSFSLTGKSPYNIAPLNKGSVQIQKSNANLGCFP